MKLQVMIWIVSLLLSYPLLGGIFLRLLEFSQEKNYYTEREQLIIVVLWPVWLAFLILLSVVVFLSKFGQNLADKFWAILTSKKRKKQ